MTDPTTRKHFECVLHGLGGARRIVHEYADTEAEARRLAHETAETIEFELLTDIDVNHIPTPPPPPGSYLLECFGCGLRGTNDDFGMGDNRQCPACGSYGVHSADLGRTS